MDGPVFGEQITFPLYEIITGIVLGGQVNPASLFVVEHTCQVCQVYLLSPIYRDTYLIFIKQLTKLLIFFCFAHP